MINILFIIKVIGYCFSSDSVVVKLFIQGIIPGDGAVPGQDLDWMITEGLFLLTLFCDSVVL